VAQIAQQSSAALFGVHHKIRSQIIHTIAEAIRRKQDDILEANTLDLEVSREMAIPELLIDWLKLTPERLQSTCQLLERLSEVPDPLFSTERVSESAFNYETYGIRRPLGTIALVYEAFPELAAIATGFCLRTGNVLMLRGGGETSSSNQAITNVIQEILNDAGLPQGCLQLVPSNQGDVLRELLTLDTYIDLVIPYGRPNLIQQVIKQATVPVLKTNIGNCYLFWSLSGDVEQVQHIIVDSHQGEPDAVNAIDHILIHRGCNSGTLASLLGDLKAKGFKLKGDKDLRDKIPGLDSVKDSDWNQAAYDQSITFKFIDSLDDAVMWINRNSNGHANVIVTDSYAESREFATAINSASVYINASPRFYRYHPESGAIALGMSSQATHQRGIIDFDSLTLVKRIVQGS
jgi:glutamate-5-semialdehyde dehydrogenase